MTSQEKIVKLNRYIPLDSAINQLLDELSASRTMCEKITSCMSGMPRNNDVRSHENAYTVYVQESIRINAEINEYIDERTAISRAIAAVPNLKLKTLLRHKYIDGKTWDEIGELMHYETRNIFYLHGKALQMVNM